jgi:hypothetical protein|eukprot:CAMPEP_0181179008 /NCGR_PEP_ID=MMETSP1096-20121128/6029_1 /TAXON_ID=156174 ORGANISM="Chrysochromulina ericina, Strain CCMP281" /NCGR_SAMPLE_ID=MMETSP1096 /ASSEMBLY_ACC=CAM_ASM_000453 /LENGTH=172 /DNA_ID=CAMNT_0023267325 /DNA_START=103 /DNA_END=621 /DNA_ORIENTATION=-
MPDDSICCSCILRQLPTLRQVATVPPPAKRRCFAGLVAAGLPRDLIKRSLSTSSGQQSHEHSLTSGRSTAGVGGLSTRTPRYGFPSSLSEFWTTTPDKPASTRPPAISLSGTHTYHRANGSPHTSLGINDTFPTDLQEWWRTTGGKEAWARHSEQGADTTAGPPPFSLNQIN